MSCLSDRFTIDLNPLCISVANTHALELNLQLAIKRTNTGNYTFTEPRTKIVQSQGQALAPTTC